MTARLVELFRALVAREGTRSCAGRAPLAEAAIDRDASLSVPV